VITVKSAPVLRHFCVIFVFFFILMILNKIKLDQHYQVNRDGSRGEI